MSELTKVPNKRTIEEISAKRHESGDVIPVAKSRPISAVTEYPQGINHQVVQISTEKQAEISKLGKPTKTSLFPIINKRTQNKVGFPPQNEEKKPKQ